MHSQGSTSYISAVLSSLIHSQKLHLASRRQAQECSWGFGCGASALSTVPLHPIDLKRTGNGWLGLAWHSILLTHNVVVSKEVLTAYRKHKMLTRARLYVDPNQL